MDKESNMKNNVTYAVLCEMAEQINKIMHEPTAYRTRRKDGYFETNIGHYLISHDTGEGYALHQITSVQNHSRDVLGSGLITRRELHDRMHCYLLGIEDAMKTAKFD
jgi:hypothetical protein